MIRVRVLTSSRLDQDVESHLSMLGRLPGVQVHRRKAAVAERLALIVRDAWRLSREDGADALITAGEPALLATMLTWRGPLIHLPVGSLSAAECRLLRWRSARSTRVVFSTHQAALDAVRNGVPAGQVHTINPAAPASSAAREQVRARLRVDPDATCVLLAGEVREPGGHAFALRTSSVLVFRDPRWRVYIDPGDHSDYIARATRSTSLPGSIVSCRGLSPTDVAAAADVVIVDPDSRLSSVSVAAAHAVRIPIVADARVWKQEQLANVPAILMNERKPRLWANAAIRALESPVERIAPSRASHDLPQITAQHWLDAIQSVCGMRRERVA